MERKPLIATVVAAVFSILWPAPAAALSLKEFRKFSSIDQGTYIIGAVSMLAYTYAANGEVAKARCIQNRFFRGVKKGVDTPGGREMDIEIGVAEQLDAEKYHIEGVILGVTDKACAVPPVQSKAKP